MKFLFLILFVMVAAVAVNGYPGGEKFKKKGPTCSSACPASYEPVCGADLNEKSSKPRLFANECLLAVHNCEHNAKLVPVGMQKCEGVGGIRLS